MQYEVTKMQDLLDDDGKIVESGWARYPVWNFNKDKIHAAHFHVKEWDTYTVMSEGYAVIFKMTNLGYVDVMTVALIDFVHQNEIAQSVFVPNVMGKKGMDIFSRDGNIDFKNKKIHLRYSTKPNRRRIQCVFHDFADGKTLTADLLMKQSDSEMLCVATPARKKIFLYNENIMCIPVKGRVSLGEEDFVFDEENDMAVCDRGCSVYSGEIAYYRGSCSTWVNGKPFGFNIGYGFGDRKMASENAVFYDGKLHKLEQVTFFIPEDKDGNMQLTQGWSITSSDGRFEAIFMPIIEKTTKFDWKLIASKTHQVFGHLTGTVILDDGTELKLKETLAVMEVAHRKL